MPSVFLPLCAANASFKLGQLVHGDLGLDKTIQKAEKWLERAASQNPEKRDLSPGL